MGERDLQQRFLALLDDVDLSEFPDLSFDGIFEGDENFVYFLNWLVDNVSKDQVSTSTEELLLDAVGDELSKLEENPSEINVPSYEEVESVDTDYVEYVLPNELKIVEVENERLEKLNDELLDVIADTHQRRLDILSQSTDLNVDLENAVKSCYDKITHTDRIIKQTLQTFSSPPRENINVDSFIDHFADLDHELNKLICNIKDFELHELNENDERLLKIKKQIYDTEKERVLSKCELEEFKATECFKPEGSAGKKELFEQVQQLEEELDKVAEEVSEINVAKVLFNIKHGHLEIMNETNKTLQNYINILEINEPPQQVASILLKKQKNSLKNVLEYLHKTKTTLLDEVQYLETSPVNKILVKSKSPKNIFLSNLIKILNVSEHEPFEILVHKSACFNSQLKQCLDKSMQNIFMEYDIMFQSEKLLKIVRKEIESSCTNALQIYPVNYVENRRKHEAMLTSLNNLFTSLANNFVQVKNDVRKDKKRKLRLLWTWFLTLSEPGTMRQFIDRQETL